VELADTLCLDFCWGSPFVLLETGFQPIGPSSDFYECVFVYIDSSGGNDPLGGGLRREAICSRHLQQKLHVFRMQNYISQRTHKKVLGSKVSVSESFFSKMMIGVKTRLSFSSRMKFR
jgi:hypothetical protein